MDYRDSPRHTTFRDLPRSQQVWTVIFGLVSLAFLVYGIVDIMGFITTKNPMIAAREAQEPILRWFWPVMAILASFVFFAVMQVTRIDTTDGWRAALRQFMREMRIIK